jgi:RNA polymerase sigma-70 factor (ECF subfamily)
MQGRVLRAREKTDGIAAANRQEVELFMDFERLFDEYYDKIYVYILRRVNNSHDAEDLTADVFTKAFSGAFKPQVAGAYLYAAAANAVKNHYRAASVRKNIICFTPENEPRDEIDLAGDLITREEFGKLKDALTLLSERDYETVYRRYYLDESFAQIGAALGVTEPGARKIHERALFKLKKNLSPASRFTMPRVLVKGDLS